MAWLIERRYVPVVLKMVVEYLLMAEPVLSRYRSY